MAFPLKDVRYTTRTSGGERLVYPKLLRDRAILPRIDVAIQYFESLLGEERRTLDPESLVHFFGDHKLARCMVACLARSYRYRPREIEEIVTRTALRKLRRAGADSPRALRALLYDHVNDVGHGYLPRAGRVETLAKIEGTLGLRGGELERLLYLDAEEHAVLGRVGARPRSEDVVAQYHLDVLGSLLRHAEAVELQVAPCSAELRAGLQALCAANAVELEIDQRARGAVTARLLGRRDALGGWTRHGRRLARAVVQVVELARRSIADGRATLALRERRGVLRLTDETLDYLAGAAAARSAGWQDDAGWGALAVAQALGAGRAPLPGVRARRWPDPRAWAAGTVVAELLVAVGRRGTLVCVVRSAAHGAQLAPVALDSAGGEPHLFVGNEAALAPLAAVGSWTLPLPAPDLHAVLLEVQRDRVAAPVARVA